MRQDIDLYFIQMANLVGTRGTCNRGNSGCVIIRNKQVISTGYVGSPAGTPHCDEVGHQMENNHCIRTTHAEQNAIVNAAKNGISTDGSTLYCTMFPCYTCAKMIVNAGIKRVVADYDYQTSKLSKKLFLDLKLEYLIINDEIKSYETV
jgi:dCMP deaminase